MKLQCSKQAKQGVINKLALFGKRGKRRQITFRIGPIAQDRLEQAADLFNMKPAQFAKAVLYFYLQIFNEPLDRRHRKRLTTPRQRRR